MASRVWHVYILASRPRGVLYVGVTGDLARRVREHRNDVVEGFTKRYEVHRLVHAEAFGDPEEAIRREKRLKRWRRAWKVALIEQANPEWEDLYARLTG